MKNESKTFESSKLDSNCDSSLILSRSSNFDCNCSLVGLGLLTHGQIGSCWCHTHKRTEVPFEIILWS